MLKLFARGPLQELMAVMSEQRTPAYDQLAATYLRLHRFGHLHALAAWDQAALMPARGNQARAEALAEIALLTHRLRTDAQVVAHIERAEQEPLADAQRANLREIRRDWWLANALPESLVEARQLASSRCEHAWRSQRPANDWAGFLVNFRDVVRLAREEAKLLQQQTGAARYDTLIERFEPGMTGATVERVFGEIKQWLPGLIRQVQERQSAQPVLQPQGPFPAAAQHALSQRVMRLLGFDFSAGRLDLSTHPFTGGVPEDVRLTTRYDEQDFLTGLMGTIHETGHAMYEQHLPRADLGQPVAQARSTAIHESQSLSFEMQLARHPGFMQVLQPLLREQLGDQSAFELGNLQRLVTRVAPGLIRVDADELTYPAHVMLRWEIERALIEGEIEAEDIPALWDAKMMDLLGLDTRGNHTDGALQDVHWPEGWFGYFPCYTLGAMYAAQWFAAMRRRLPELDRSIARGDFAPMLGWLQDQIWSQASRWSTDELAQRASGETLNPAHFRAHLEARYLA
jgi:carboxypeptidase Taq